MLHWWKRWSSYTVSYQDVEDLVPRSVVGNWESDELHMSPQGSHQLGLSLSKPVAKAMNSLTRSAKRLLREGQNLEFLNVKTGRWTLAQVVKVSKTGAIMVSGCDQEIPEEEFPQRVRLLQPPSNVGVGLVAGQAGQWASPLAQPDSDPWLRSLVVGCEVEFRSMTLQQWIRCRVTDIDFDGGLQVDVKPGYVIRREEQAERIRNPLHSVPRRWNLGDRVEYNSPSLQQWVRCHVTRVDPDGNLYLDVKPGVPLNLQEQSQLLRAPQLRPDSNLVVGEEVEYFNPRSKVWEKSTVNGVDARLGAVSLDTLKGKALTQEEQVEFLRMPRDAFLHYS